MGKNISSALAPLSLVTSLSVTSMKNAYIFSSSFPERTILFKCYAMWTILAPQMKMKPGPHWF